MSISLHLFLLILGIALLKYVHKCIADLGLQHNSAGFGLLFLPLIIHRKTADFPKSQAPFPYGKHNRRSKKLDSILKANTLGKFIKRICASTDHCVLCGASVVAMAVLRGQQRVLGGGLSMPNFSQWKLDDTYF